MRSAGTFEKGSLFAITHTRLRKGTAQATARMGHATVAASVTGVRTTQRAFAVHRAVHRGCETLGIVSLLVDGDVRLRDPIARDALSVYVWGNRCGPELGSRTR